MALVHAAQGDGSPHPAVLSALLATFSPIAKPREIDHLIPILHEPA
jgi:hypothetical protein